MGTTYTPPNKDAWSGVVGELTGMSDGSAAGNAGARVHHTMKAALRAGERDGTWSDRIPPPPRSAAPGGFMDASSRVLACIGAILGLLYGLTTGDGGLTFLSAVAGLVAGFLIPRLLVFALWLALVLAAIAVGVGALMLLFN
jgi:hypothetical protein